MSKYSYPQEYLIYYSGTEIPINKKRIKNSAELQVFDKALLLKSYYYFVKNLNNNTKFDEKYFINLHKITFEKLYSFAGKFREQDVSKGTTVFCKALYIKEHLKKLFLLLKEENYLKDFSEKPKELFANRIAFYMGELISIHPFWEFNGRIIRLFFDLIAIYNGYSYIDYSKYQYEGEENSYIQASIECVQQGNIDMLTEIIKVGLNKQN